MVQEEYFVNIIKEVKDEIAGYEVQIAEIDSQLEFETAPSKHSKLKQELSELESGIEIAQVKFNSIAKEREVSSG